MLAKPPTLKSSDFFAQFGVGAVAVAIVVVYYLERISPYETAMVALGEIPSWAGLVASTAIAFACYAVGGGMTAIGELISPRVPDDLDEMRETVVCLKSPNDRLWQFFERSKQRVEFSYGIIGAAALSTAIFTLMFVEGVIHGNMELRFVTLFIISGLLCFAARLHVLNVKLEMSRIVFHHETSINQ